MYAFVSGERKPQKRNLFQLLKKLRLVLQPLMNSSPKLENLWHWRSHDHLQTSCCPKRHAKNVVATITASNSASWPHSDLTRHRPSSVAKILNAKLKNFFARRIETSATRRPKVVSALDCLRKCLTREEAPWGATKWSPPSPCRWPFTCRDVQ